MATYYVKAVGGNNGNAGTSEGAAWATLSYASTQVAAGDTVNIKGDADYAEGWTVQTTAGTAAAPITWRAYNATPGDGGLATVTGSASRAYCMRLDKDYNSFEGLVFTAPTTGCVDQYATTYSTLFLRCKFQRGAGGTGLKGLYSSTFASYTVRVVESLFDGLTGIPLTLYYNGWLEACAIKGCGAITIAGYNNGVNVRGCLIYDSPDHGISLTSNTSDITIVGNTIDGVTGSGIYSASSTTVRGIYVSRNLITNSSGYGISYPSAIDGAFLGCDWNAFYNNTSGARNNFPAGARDLALSADPYANRSGKDYSPNTTAGGGAALRAAYGPTFPGGLTTGYLDIGAVQHRDQVGSLLRYLGAP